VDRGILFLKDGYFVDVAIAADADNARDGLLADEFE
tara:strand:- start:82 stop:189 length:108 start_codon:yes stop_codon:yes gene_type:complete